MFTSNAFTSYTNSVSANIYANDIGNTNTNARLIVL